MALDNRKLKTPFYKISIGRPDSNVLIPLPHHISRLIKSIDIQEALGQGAFHVVNIKFVEGSREPALISPAMGTKGLYKLDDDIAGSITNRIGTLADLRFSGSSGITFKDEDETKTGKLNSTKLQENIKGNQVSRKYENEKSAPTFLFQERNHVQITWGYKEDKALQRTIRTRIMVIKATFPADSHPTLTIICNSSEPFMDISAPTEAKNYNKEEKKGKLVHIRDIPSTELLNIIADDNGFRKIISEELSDNKEEKDRFKSILTGTSLHEFLEDLAKKHNAYYQMVQDKKTGKDTLIFVRKKDWESQPVIGNTDLLNFKNPGSIIKSVTVVSDFGGISDASTVGLDQNGKKQSHTTNTAGKKYHLFYPSREGGKQSGRNRTEGIISTNPEQDIPTVSSVNKNIFNNSTTGVVENTPNQTEVGSYKDSSEAQAERQNRLIALEVKTVGYPHLMPGVYEFGGLGLRYSGKYRIMTSKHILNESGYVTSAMASTFTQPQEGLKPDNVGPGKENNNKEEYQLFQPQKESTKISGKPKKAVSTEILNELRDFFFNNNR